MSTVVSAAQLSARRRLSNRRETVAALLFISPWILGFLIFTVWPVIYSGYLSFTDYDVINDPNFVGLENYVTMFEDPRIALSLTNTLIYTILSVPAHIIVALALAMLLLRAARASGFFRTVFFLPKMTPAVAVGVLFLLLFNGQDGLINKMLRAIGLPAPYWTTDPFWVKPGLVLISLWAMGSSIVILLAALKNVPVELYESARIDGANLWQQTTRITVPMISSTIFFLVIINTIAGFQMFTEAYTAFFGSGNTTYSNDAALFFVIYLFQQGFEFLNMGYASAMAWLLFLVITIFTVVQFVVSRRLVYYEGDQR
ncbi:multiple sugar transport system permease protein [Conyzicola nivalis]|uniref:Multiple sugar transport system permease protein n=1 Tax=Conyzicola nivalis TaxID=1477021 RepID=A0ABV2QSG6_9MICO